MKYMINNNLLLTRNLKTTLVTVSQRILDLHDLMNYYESNTVFIAACIIK